ncbi:hypothetical protein E1301_Tti021731 [Triplophysa tibetana]|uniref:HECT domain-containing protein n=1 Tax=Triplophysa tibetana TaxID=1572043 RepID=A0A5A9PHJ5_9TELE|nr:hypothetical protein E1301_Tti021731 [Triplophysa tibetana]
MPEETPVCSAIHIYHHTITDQHAYYVEGLTDDITFDIFITRDSTIDVSDVQFPHKLPKECTPLTVDVKKCKEAMVNTDDATLKITPKPFDPLVVCTLTSENIPECCREYGSGSSNSISRELSSGRNTPVSTPARPPCGLLNNSTPSCNSTVQTSNTITDTSTRVNEALKRQFPNMFKSKTEVKKGKGRFARTVPIKHTDLTVCVLPAPTTVTPKATAELELSQAGLGKKVVSVLEDRKHEDIVTIMEEEFSKLHQIQGRWMRYKATGGSGQRKVSLISMESEGYSGRQLRSVSNRGRNVIFLVPLQEELDTQPLPYNSAEFAKMPKVPCVTCNTNLPLHLLALHAEECKLNSNVLGRLSAQLKQLKKGFKETGVWPLLSFRPDVLALLFPRESEAEITPQAYTCYEHLRLPDHYTSLSAFTADMMVCLRSVESGFGLVFNSIQF